MVIVHHDFMAVWSATARTQEMIHFKVLNVQDKQLESELKVRACF